MTEPRITKTLSLYQTLVQELDEIANEERRSFTRQTEIFLEDALKRYRQSQPEPEAAEAV